MELRGPRVLLREMRAADHAAVHRYARDPDVTRYTLWGPNTQEETRAHIAWAISNQNAEPRRDYTLAVELAGELVGAAHLGGVNPVHLRADLGYVLQRERWGQGIASEAAGLLLRLGFEHLGLHRIEATCDPRNAASARVLERIGMRREGQLRENYRVRDGWRDSFVYAILRPEWQAASGGGMPPDRRA